MARQRSITIYAENQEEFENILSTTEQPSRKEKTYNLSPDNTLYDTDDDESLGSTSNYTLQKKSLSIEEMEKEEESELLQEIKELSTQFKEGKVNLEDKEGEKSDNDSQTDDEDPTEKQGASRLSNLLKYNIATFDEVLKLLVIGEKNVGKSTLIKKIMEENNNENKCSHTASLEIKKVIKSIDNRKIKIELWDTNEDILNSPVITTYYKIANGFVLITDENTNFDFIKSKMEQIQSVIDTDTKFYLLFNKKSISVENSIDNLPDSIKASLNEIMSHFLVEIQICDINTFSFEKESKFNLFLRNILKNRQKLSKSLGFKK